MSSGIGLLYGLGKVMVGKVMVGKVMVGKVMVGKVMVGKVMVGKVMVEVCVRVDHCYGQYTLQTISFV